MNVDMTPRRVGNRWVFPDGKSLPVVAGGDGPETATAEKPWVPKLKRAQEIAKKAADEDRDFEPAERIEIKALVDEAAAMKAAAADAKKDKADDERLLNAM